MKIKTSNPSAKNAAAKAASDFIRPGMIVGLGSGTTASLFLKHLAEKCKHGLSIKSIATSNAIAIMAKEFEIPLLDTQNITSIDILVDGADEVDENKQMIKGHGGALLREKIVAAMSKKRIYIIDESKIVSQFKGPLPIEISSFCYKATINHLIQNGFIGQLRIKSDKEIFLTDNNNYIFDAQIDKVKLSPINIESQLKKIPGVLETGLFLNLADFVIIGYSSGHVEFLR